jgi:hypothetical protein
MIAGRTVNFFKLYEFAQLVAPDLWAEYECCRWFRFEDLTPEDYAVAETEAIEDAQKLGFERGTAQFEKIRKNKLLVAWHRYRHKAERIIAKEIPDAITAEINFGRVKITALDASNKEVEISKSQIARLEIDVLGNNLVLASDRAVIFHDIRIESAVVAAGKLEKASSDLSAEKQCLAWLIGEMKGPPRKAKLNYQTEAIRLFGVSVRAFRRAWDNGISQTRNTAWRQSGRRKKS